MQLKTRQYQPPKPDKAVGRQLLAWYDQHQVLVYVPHIGEYYDDKTVSRPIWITPSFSWMVHHTDWLESSEYDTVECMLIQHFAFEDILLKAFPARFPNSQFTSQEKWQKQQTAATIQYQWDTDYTPDRTPLNREILLLGIHSRTWMEYVINNQISPTNDIDDALFRQKDRAKSPYDLLIVPDEKPYLVEKSLQENLGMTS